MSVHLGWKGRGGDGHSVELHKPSRGRHHTRKQSRAASTVSTIMTTAPSLELSVSEVRTTRYTLTSRLLGGGKCAYYPCLAFRRGLCHSAWRVDLINTQSQVDE